MRGSLGIASCSDLRVLVPLLLLGVLGGVSLASLADHGRAHDWARSVRLDPSTGEGFGSALVVDGDTLAVSGEAIRIYERTGDGSWVFSQVLPVPSNPFAEDGPWGVPDGQRFGAALALDAREGLLVVAAPGFDVSGNVTDHETDAGAVYLYERDEGGSWGLVERIVGPVNGDWNDREGTNKWQSGPSLGTSVDVDGSSVAVGVPLARTDGTTLRGAVRVYERVSEDDWVQARRLSAPDPWGERGDFFGLDLALAGDRLAVGAPLEDTSAGEYSGAVYVYQRTATGWEFRSRITEAAVYARDAEIDSPGLGDRSPLAGGEFGFAIDFDASGSTLVVGAPLRNRVAGVALPSHTVGAAGRFNWGTMYVFQEAGGTYEHAATLIDPAWEMGSGFASNLDVDSQGQTIVVGAWMGNQSDVNGFNVDRGAVSHRPATGTAYVFERVDGGDWSCSAELSGHDTDIEPGRYGGDRFGSSLGISGSTAFVGAPNNGEKNSGTAYGFEAIRPIGGSGLGDGVLACGLGSASIQES